MVGRRESRKIERGRDRWKGYRYRQRYKYNSRQIQTRIRERVIEIQEMKEFERDNKRGYRYVYVK